MRLPILALALVFVTSVVRAQTPPPNLVVLFCDDAGYGDFGFQGHPTIRTPRLDRMAAEGMRFTQFYSASPACTASRYGLLTGRHPSRSGFSWVLYPKSRAHLDPKETTVAEVLRERGYATAIFGKWHLGFPCEANGMSLEALPLAHGFQEWCGLPYSNDMLRRGREDYPILRLFEAPVPEGRTAFLPGYAAGETEPDQRTLTALYTERALDFIRRSRKGPFFLYLPYAMPHVPLHPGEAFAGRSPRGAYGDVIEEIDDSVGRILDGLRAAGVEKNTLVLFTSDNGPWIIKGLEGGSAGLLRDGKGSTWEGGMRVPALARWPGVIAPGTRCDEIATALDLLPTAAELAGAKRPAATKLDGRSLVSVLRGRAGGPPAPPVFYGGPGRSAIQAVRRDRWKLHLKTNSQTGSDHGWPGVSREKPLLFDLDVDPGETRSVAAEHPDLVRELLALVDAFEAR
ncbi:MAG: sulfatase [Planctomycetota bacterium]